MIDIGGSATLQLWTEIARGIVAGVDTVRVQVIVELFNVA